jgi:16S rRNA (cytosine967-C5)-methyltransferase
MSQTPEKTPLWRQLQEVAKVIASVKTGVSGTKAVESVPADLRPGVQSLSFQVWRNWGRATALRQLLAPRKPAPAVDALLCVALALVWDEASAPYDAFTLVNQTVEAAKRGGPLQRQANFINACLRRFLREMSGLIARTDNDLQARWNHPLWWIERLQNDHPQHWEAILHAANQHAPMTLRVNVRKTNVTVYLALLAQAGIAGLALGPSGILLERAVPVQSLPYFSDGWVSVQDAAAQMAAPLLLNSMVLAEDRSIRILDACAAPGGKTGHLLELSDGVVTALELDGQRATRIAQNLSRLGLSAQVLVGDASQPQTWWDGVPFDAILLDAPCTASGIVRRHPDVRWLRREADVGQLAALQGKILQSLWPLLAPGGHLVYATCSVFRQEGSAQVQTFLAHNTDARVLPAPGHLIPEKSLEVGDVRDNQATHHDGFFYALFQKQPAPRQPV